MLPQQSKRKYILKGKNSQNVILNKFFLWVLEYWMIMIFFWL